MRYFAALLVLLLFDRCAMDADEKNFYRQCFLGQNMDAQDRAFFYKTMYKHSGSDENFDW